MSDQDVLKEFLVSIGYKVDEASERKAFAGVERLTKGALALGASVTAMAVAVGAGVQRVAVSFDSLYFASGRIGAKSGDIKAFQYAISQLGGTSEGAMQSLENLARKMRENPGTAKQIEFATGTQIKNGKISEQNIKDMGSYFRRLIDSGRGYQAIAFAEMWGFDEKTMRGMAVGIDKFADQYHKKTKAAGLDPDSAAENAQRFMKAWRDIFSTLEVIVDSTLTKVMGDGKGGLGGFAAWFEKQTPAISEGLSKVTTAFSEVVRAWADDFSKIEWKGAGKDIGDFATQIANLVKAFTGLIGEIKGAVEWIDKWDKAIGISSFLNKISGANATPGQLKENRMRSVASNSAIGSSEELVGAEGGMSAGKWLAGKWRNRPKWMGGEGGGAKLSDLSRRGGAMPKGDGATPISHMMGFAMDQLRKEGVPEGNLRAAAAHLVGQAYMESTLDPGKKHDYEAGKGYTGYGIYGARLDRRDKMFGWLEANGYQRNSAEGQMRYMAHEAMNGRAYSRTRDILMNAQAGTLAGSTAAVTKNFENPLIVNDRSGAVLKAYATGPNIVGPTAPVAASVGGALYDSAGNSMGKPLPRKPAAAAPIPRNPFGAINPNTFKTAPLGSGQINSWRAPTTNNNSSTVNVKVDGAQDPEAVGRQVARRVEDASNRTLRNAQGAVN